MSDIWPVLLSALVSAIGMYIGFVNKMRMQIGVLEEKVKHLENRQDSQSKKNDEVINLITEFKLEMAEKIGNVSIQMSKISADVEIINSTIAVFDAGVVSKNKKKK